MINISQEAPEAAFFVTEEEELSILGSYIKYKRDQPKCSCICPRVHVGICAPKCSHICTCVHVCICVCENKQRNVYCNEIVM